MTITSTSKSIGFMKNKNDSIANKYSTIKNIFTFNDIDECLTWMSNEYPARDECVEVLNENC